MNLNSYIQRQIDWSKITFGEGMRTLGIIEHISSELIEIEEQPDDLAEWVDVIILALDGAWRAGHSPKEIAEALQEKQRMNFEREWPIPKSENKAVYHKRMEENGNSNSG